nr:NAD(P)H-hydrate dehydratase [uncultured Anaerostipes sp.]
MKYVLKNQEMQDTDHETIHEIKIPGLVLMERASEAVANRAETYLGAGQKTLVIAGTGNNGGDALAAARILLERDYHVDYKIIGNIEKASEDLKLQHQILENLGYAPVESWNLKDYDLIIEGIFGVGLSREVGGIYRDVIEEINEAELPVIAIDIPSGISGDSGKVMGCAVKAVETVTFGGYKRGHLLYPGRQYCGKVTLADIGFHRRTIKKYASGFTLEKETNLMPKREAYSNKGTYGKILMITGNESMSGAAVFAGEAALRMGAGLVKILSDESNRGILQNRLPEILFGRRQDLKEALSWCDCILFGPGTGVSEETKEMLEFILANGKAPLILDADGLNTVSRYEMQLHYPYGLILTPHLMEGARLLKKDIKEVKVDICKAAQAIAEKFHGTAVLKDAATVVAQKQKKLYINQSGNHGMAVGGSGDVLAGMITGLAGTGCDLFEAAVKGVYLHGLAGDAAMKEKGPYSMIASDILQHIKDVTGGEHESILSGPCSH